MQIRQENKSDWNSVYRVVREAFRKAEHSDGNEQELVTALRKSAAFVPELSLVAEENGSVVGYVLFTEARIGNRTGLALAPLAVLPDFQNKGIGAALVREGHRRAGELRYGCCVVLGSERYYPRFGYVPAHVLGIETPHGLPPENFMAFRLDGGAEPVGGTVKYAEEFGL